MTTAKEFEDFVLAAAGKPEAAKEVTVEVLGFNPAPIEVGIVNIRTSEIRAAPASGKSVLSDLFSWLKLPT